MMTHVVVTHTDIAIGFFVVYPLLVIVLRPRAVFSNHKLKHNKHVSRLKYRLLSKFILDYHVMLVYVSVAVDRTVVVCWSYLCMRPLITTKPDELPPFFFKDSSEVLTSELTTFLGSDCGGEESAKDWYE